MEEFFTASNFVALLTLLVLEIVLGIDNVIFISILSARLPANQQQLGRQLGIGMAMVSRILLLLAITWVQSLEHLTIFTLFGNDISGKDLVLILGGLFLIGKSTYEIHEKLEGAEHSSKGQMAQVATLSSVVLQILLIDLVFSLDSVITAVGIADLLATMIIAIVVASMIMIVFANSISGFVEKHPTMKMLALSFLILIGVMLVIEGWAADLAHDLHIRNYIYFAMAFSFGVELLNMQFRKHSQPVKLHNQPVPAEVAAATGKPKASKPKKSR